MHNNNLSYLLALGANFSFATASIIFATYSHKISSLWMNAFKAVVTLLLLVLTIPWMGGFHTTTFSATSWFFLSGFVGLTIGDLFLLRSFSLIGPSRTLILFGFQPIIMGIAGPLLFNQELQNHQLMAIPILMCCLFLFSYEGRKNNGHWEIKGLLFALTGVLFDACGIFLSRKGFDISELAPVEGHFYRTLGAVVGFALISKFIKPVKLVHHFKAQPNKARLILLFSAFAGTYLSLLMYMSAIKMGNLASISAIAITGPIFATFFECLYYKKYPGKFLWMSLALFVFGFLVLYNGGS
jgi:drug/metabolite transporter (DMT)-like permease